MKPRHLTSPARHEPALWHPKIIGALVQHRFYSKRLKESAAKNAWAAFRYVLATVKPFPEGAEAMKSNVWTARGYKVFLRETS